MSSPFRVVVKEGDRRLLRGYGPLVLAIAAFLAMALLVPTIAPEQNVAATQAGSGLSASNSSGLGSGSTSAGAASSTGSAASTSGAGGSSSANSGGSGAAARAGGASQGSSVAASGTGTGSSARVASCSGPQVPGDPYSPPCISFSGSNGGSTYRGVTSEDIVLSYLNPTDGSVSDDQRIAAVIGHYGPGVFPENWADVEETLQNLVTYFNDHFQFYGRKIVLRIYNGQENSSGTNQSQVNADALTVADSIKAFAELDASNEAYQDALARQGVVSFGANYLPESHYQEFSPYEWGSAPDCTELAQELGAVAVKELVPNPVAFGGTGVPDGTGRRLAVVFPDAPAFAPCGSIITSDLKAAGHPPSAIIAYDTDPSKASPTTEGVTQTIVNDKITTVLCVCDPVFQLLVSGGLDSANYLPEWFNAAVVSEESDLFAQQMDQAAWAHTALISNEIVVPGKYGSTLGYFAAKSVDPSGFIVNEVDSLYEELYQVALGIQLAGPDLTPTTFAQGLWSYAGGNGEYGPWSFNVGGVHYYTPIHQFRYQWWDPNLVSTYDDAKGAWVIDPKWYATDDVPGGPPPVFPNGPQ